MSKFFVLGLPRSRTYWLANFLGCLHEGLYYYPDYNDFMKSDHVGDSTTAYPLIKDFISDRKKVIIHRDNNDVLASCRNLFGDVDLSFIVDEDKALRDAEGLHIDFNDIDNRIEEIWSYCREGKFPSMKYFMMKDVILNNDFIIEETRKVLVKAGSHEQILQG